MYIAGTFTRELRERGADKLALASSQYIDSHLKRINRQIKLQNVKLDKQPALEEWNNLKQDKYYEALALQQYVSVFFEVNNIEEEVEVMQEMVTETMLKSIDFPLKDEEER